ncbi:hypothetical protein TNCV_388511 [Trichonephila clavipes]|nr:hypothetical protein TNCV_388511 [Trichonephila clavipes]
MIKGFSGAFLSPIDTLLSIRRLFILLTLTNVGRGSQMVKISDRGWLVTISSPVPLKTHRVGERCTLNPSRAQTSSLWCDMVVRRGGASSGVVLVT